MTVNPPQAKTPSPNKSRRAAPKPWSSSSKATFKEWVKEDYLKEFSMSDSDWDILDAQVIQPRSISLIADEESPRRNHCLESDISRRELANAWGWTFTWCVSSDSATMQNLCGTDGKTICESEKFNCTAEHWGNDMVNRWARSLVHKEMEQQENSRCEEGHRASEKKKITYLCRMWTFVMLSWLWWCWTRGTALDRYI